MGELRAKIAPGGAHVLRLAEGGAFDLGGAPLNITTGMAAFSLKLAYFSSSRELIGASQIRQAKRQSSGLYQQGTQSLRGVWTPDSWLWRQQRSRPRRCRSSSDSCEREGSRRCP